MIELDELKDIFTIPLFRNFTGKMQEEVLERLEYRIDHYRKGEVIIRQGTVCNYLHILLKGKLYVDVLDVSGGKVRVETIRAPRTFATPHIFAQRNLFPATFTVIEDVTLLRATKESVFALMNSMPLFLQNFLCVSTSCNKCTMTRLRVLTFRGIRNRFIYYLFDNVQEGTDVVELEHNQVQLAEYFGVTRPALAKEIRKLVEEGLISISNRKVKILDRHALSCML
ncbi:CRP-like cAMP-binding protein [Parabacteroides sp. PF5-5]|uniref:Crp/Fnr family transcriptional regulator n=1 Tax=unclassified Parabacteroides TaxID=2649774 RepID=UPI0024759940|nr:MULTISPECIES: Crp/Fnr family transcriptional regulator [unclassified Parabacteroides]MDH6304758.1 CRP-like cAMP-binding protein [Parabacteroides sp. PH5-39]MDH6315627.1 CRP-like cAMP-binding protein [Parabacteroides sp. PF5-13]MDH6319288.1 CRP-like cAMP-binding protein [Parabacteroides sp. PH5-13]MDH6323019.1 CRP-like cAMP-binding protein [Parabacteroides sp. PH5-8]MDH6326820.1 CRP-like cAMP-binding protein [Parabacteroides sp. PH5-41]